MNKIYCDIKKCLGCGSCEIACVVEHSTSKKLANAIQERPLPIKRRKVEFIANGISISSGCYHCEIPVCIDSCMSGALYKDKDTGMTLHDKNKCVGCWMCIMRCPFGALSREKEEKVVIKCDFCPDRKSPACVSACPTKALFCGMLEEFNRKVTK